MNDFLKPFDPNNDFYLLPPGQGWEVDRKPVEQDFYTIAQKYWLYGGLFSVSLVFTQLSRLVPGFQSLYILLAIGGLVGSFIYLKLSRQNQNQIAAALVALALFTGIVGGWWDAISAVMALPTGYIAGLRWGTIAIVFALVLLFDKLLSRKK